MHPDHVADLVAEQVEALREELAGLDLPVTNVELRNSTELLIGFTSETSEAVENVMGLPGGTAVPLIGTRRREQFIVHFDCEEFESKPPIVVLLDSEENLLPPERWPHDSSQRGIVQGHPDYPGRKFFCRPGTREFHTHPQHEHEPWDEVREGMALDQIALGLLRDLNERWTIR